MEKDSHITQLYKTSQNDSLFVPKTPQDMLHFSSSSPLLSTLRRPLNAEASEGPAKTPAPSFGRSSSGTNSVSKGNSCTTQEREGRSKERDRDDGIQLRPRNEEQQRHKALSDAFRWIRLETCRTLSMCFLNMRSRPLKATCKMDQDCGGVGVA